MAKERTKIDSFLLCLIILFLLLGFLILFSVSASISQREFNEPYYYLRHQLLFGLAPGIILCFLALKCPLKKLEKWSHYFLLGNILLLLLLFVTGPGLSVSGAKRWIKLGPISFQPSEFLKVTLLLYVAAWLNKKSKKEKRKKETLICFCLILSLIAAILIFQPDISTLLIVVFGVVMIYFLSETPFQYTLLIIGVGIASFSFLANSKMYRLKRLLVFINPDLDPMGMGYQVKQTLITIGSGGLWGKGLGLSKQKFGFLPNVLTDTIFAAFCEEAGFFGGIILIALFLLLFARVFWLVKKKNDLFAKSLAIGLVGAIVAQAFLNITSMIGLVPLTGTPLPFISYGGSHMVSELISLGIILNISKNAV